ncbi:hypothetical protein L915_19542 [Phytophthora nicotianae]|uniref:Uncharacterized protein n=1 Tax=Phytophthora nicotianae TaxID=4792 RepID=W2FU21_PHYNI|nr:hypothetical protein L915_19542 [Phytophthora nicotianae]
MSSRWFKTKDLGRASASQISGSCPSIVTNSLSSGASFRQSPGAALLSSSGPKRHCTLSTGTRYSFNWYGKSRLPLFRQCLNTNNRSLSSGEPHVLSASLIQE